MDKKLSTEAAGPSAESRELHPPKSRQELYRQVKELGLKKPVEKYLIYCIDSLISQIEREWEKSKREAIRAADANFRSRLEEFGRELKAKDTTFASVVNFYEKLVVDLTDRVNRDPKTRLINYRRFIEELEKFLSLEQRGEWCTVGLADVTNFKHCNDFYGHVVGDKVLACVANLLRDQIRSEDDLLTQVQDERTEAQPVEEERRSQELHARFGGDEFCFLLPHMANPKQAYFVADRFRTAVELYDWSSVDPRMASNEVRVDVGVICLLMGPVSERHLSKQLAHDILEAADKLMYEAKDDRADHIYMRLSRIQDGNLEVLPTIVDDASI